MNKFITTLALSVITAVAMAAANSTTGNKLQCFSGTEDGDQGGVTYGGTCLLNHDGSATLDTTDGDPDGSYAGVYISPGLPGKPVGNVTKLSFSFTGGPVSGGSPRLSIPIDEDGDGTTEEYAFIDASNCGVASGGTVGLSCPVFYHLPVETGGTLYSNWAAFVTANPTYKIAKDALAFVIVDQPFSGTVFNVQLGKASAK